MRKMQTALFAFAALLWVGPAVAAGADAASKANIQGVIQDGFGYPVVGAEVEVVKEGVVVATATSGKSGGYAVECIEEGSYELRLDPKDEFQGQRVVAPLDGRGLQVNWSVDESKPAIATATATGGACGDVVACLTDAGGTACPAPGPAAPAGEAGQIGAVGAGSGGVSTGAIVTGGVLGGTAIGLGAAGAAGAFDSDDPETDSQ